MIKKKLLRILLEIQKVSEIVPSHFIIKESDALITIGGNDIEGLP